MIDLETLEKLQSASVEERIYIIEAILQSLKNDLGSSSKPSPVGYGDYTKERHQSLNQLTIEDFRNYVKQKRQ